MLAWGLTAVAVMIGSGVAASWYYAQSDGSPELTGALADSAPLPAAPRGPSGLPLPRYVSLKSSKVNVRIGPSQDHGVAWVFNTAGLPVEIIAEFENWRRIRDSEGAEGWVYHSLLSGQRTALVAPWQKDKETPAELLYASADANSRPVARLEHGALVRVEECRRDWCEVRVAGVGGYLRQDMLWGVYPGEHVTE